MVVDLNPSSAKADSPTNPLFTDSLGDTDRIYTVIAKDHLSTFTPAYLTSTASLKELSNLNTTKGFRIKNYNALTTEGLVINPSDFTTYYYYVLIYSDNDKKHHFARITEIKNEDTAGDAFEFEPKLGNEIPKETKFRVFKGHAKSDTDIVAVSFGITGTLDTSLICAKPLFYFHNELLDKPNELDHNTKYYCMQKAVSALTNPATFDTTNAVVFRTAQDFGKTVIDYSKYSHRITLTDKLRDLDSTISGGITINEGSTITADTNDYNEMFPNARRDINDLITSRLYTGPSRYLHYDYSPTKSNLLYNVFEHYNIESIDGKGGYAETIAVDSSRILPKKIKEFNAYRVRHNIHSGDLDEFKFLRATYSSTNSTNNFNFNTEYNLETYLNAGDEVKIDNSILIVSSFGSLSSGVQSIAFRAEVRAEDSGIFASATVSPTSGASLHRRAYNATDNTLMLDMSLLNGRFSKMYVSFTSSNNHSRFATVTGCDEDKSLITLSFENNSYTTKNYLGGQYFLYIERFNGEIENIQIGKEFGQTTITIKGRDKFNKLLSPVVNLNTLFTEDIIYSSNSPYNKLGDIKSGSTYTVVLGATTIDTDLVSGTSYFDNFPVLGTKLFTVNGYVGEVTATELYATVKRRLIITPALTELNSEALYMETEKNYVLNKSLSSSHLTNDKPSSLLGAANKGIIFTAGTKLASILQRCTTQGNTTLTVSDSSVLTVGMFVSGTNIVSETKISSITNATTVVLNLAASGSTSNINLSFVSEGVKLPKTSSNLSEGAEGYAIKSPSSISIDNSFQTLLADEHGSSPNADFDVVNTLIDFEVINVSKKGNLNQIELAPYIPVTLGRKTNYYEEVDEYTFTEVGTITAFGNIDNLYFKMTTTNAHSLKKGEPLFMIPHDDTTANKTFIGLVFDIYHTATTVIANETYVQLDRSPIDLTTNDIIYKATKPSNDLVLINGSHLWGGKILTRPHPTMTSIGAVPLNVESTTIAGDYTSRFGQPYYKTTGLLNGTFNLNLPAVKVATKKIRNAYPNKGKFNYSVNAYNFKPNTGSSNLNLANTTSDSYRVLPPEERGLTSPFGSNFSDIRIHLTDNRVFPQLQILEQRTKAAFTHIDESAARLFLYINSDILPYSSLRKDSLLFSSGGSSQKQLSNYKMLLLENKKVKDSSSNGGNRLKLTDSNFQTLSFSTEQDLSKLKRFGMMRLTEVCVDFFFNVINPEKTIIKTLDNTYGLNTQIGTKTSVGTIQGINAKIVTFTGNVSLSAGDFLFDDKGRLIGTVASGSNAAWTLTQNATLTNNGSAASTCFKVDLTSIILKGRNLKDTFARLDSNAMHPLKCCIIPSLSNYGDDSGDDANEANDDTALSFPTFGSSPRRSELVGPVAHNISLWSTAGQNANVGNYKVIQQITDYAAGNYIGSRGHNSLIGVVLDRFDIEDGGKYKAEEGNTTQTLIGTSEVNVDDGSTQDNWHTVIGSSYPFKKFDNVSDTSGSYGGSRPYEADGAFIGFKLRLWVDSANYSTSSITSSSGTLKNNLINTSRATSSESTFQNTFLKFVDLTGCYLVPEKGVNSEATSFSKGTVEQRRGMDGAIPMHNSSNTLIHIISHEVLNSNSEHHHLICDGALVNDTAYRILQPNETCLYDFMPEEIKFNYLSSNYTKTSNQEKVYNIKNSYFYKEGQVLNTNSNFADEAILSMFVIVDTDKQSGSGVNNDNGLVLSSTDDFFTSNLPEGNYSMVFSDGENSDKISFTSTNNLKYNSIILSKGLNRQGIVSVSEAFTVNSNQKLEIEPTRACIGSTVSIGLEGEDLINELLEQESIEFTTTSNNTPMYLAPNYQGVDLYSAIRYILEKKDMKLLEENNIFKIIPDNDSSSQTNIVIDDSGDFLIYDFQKATTVFDFYNEVIVYGGSHKSIRKDLRSIQKRGRKTLELSDNTLVTKEDVEKRALKLLRMHSTLNEKLTFNMESKGISQLRVGDIVGVEISIENISLSQYMVLEMKHELTGFITLQLGKYHKDLADIFAELIMGNKQSNAALRSPDLISNELSFDFLESIKYKELKLLVRTRNSGEGFKFGFGNAFNTATKPFGFSESAVTYTTLIDEDLA